MRAKRREAMLEFFTIGRSYADVEEEYGISYHTAWRNVHELMEENMVEELPNRDDDGRLMFIGTGRRDRKVLMVQWKDRTQEPLGEVLTKFHRPYMEQEIDNTVLTKPYELMAYLYRRATILKQLEGGWDSSPAAARGGVIEPAAVRIKLRAAHRQLLTQASIIEQVLLRSELFDDNREVADLFGIENEDTRHYVSELGAHYVARGREG